MCPFTEKPVLEEIGLRELRQHASDVVRRAESGTEFVVTVAGRGAARLVPVGPKTWCTAASLTAIFAAPAWGADAEARDYLDQDLRDPWQREE